MAASSTQTPIGPFDVFISHRGEVMKHTFVSSLYRALVEDQGCECFLDKDELLEGFDAPAQLLDAVRTSRIHLPIFTVDYGSSEWCLDELVEMMDSKKNGMSVVYPVFFDVKPEELRIGDGEDVRLEELVTVDGSLASNFKKFIQMREGQFGEDRIKQWVKALWEASLVVGFELQTYNKDWGALIADIKKRVLTNISEALPVHAETSLVGLDAKVEAVLRGYSLHSQSSVYSILIFGEGGIGKTTLAKEIYIRHRKDFDITSFVNCVSEREVQEELCRDLLRESSILVLRENNISVRDMLARILSGKKVLIVFDDVKDFQHVKCAMYLHKLCPGSLVLLTSRNQTVFPHGKDFNSTFRGERYELQMMDDPLALNLLCHHVWRLPNPEPGFEKLAMEVVHACAGRPLYLEVVGRHLNSMKTKGQWREAVGMLRECIFEELSACLMISYNDLKEHERQMFLDVACFLNGEFELTVKRFWAVSVKYWETGLEKLKQRCLVKVDKFMRLTMHDHLRDLGREICKRCKTRVWIDEDLKDLLKKGKDLDEIRGIATSLPRLDLRELSAMSSLHLLFLDGTELTGAVNSLEVLEVRWLKWKNCPSELPSFLGKLKRLQNFSIDNYSLEEILDKRLSWEERKLRNCKWTFLKKLPEDSGSLEYLEELNICSTSFTQLPSSLGKWKKLRLLSVKGCKQFKKLPEDFGSLESLEKLDLSQTAITELPSSLGKLRSLWHLNLISCLQLKKLPEDLNSLESLIVLDLSQTSITELPSSLGKLKRLQRLNLNSCIQLKKLPENLGSLENLIELNLYQTSITKLPSSLRKLKSLRKLDISGCELLKELPDDIGSLENLEELLLRETCITELPPSIGKLRSLQKLNISGCKQLKKLPDDIGCLESLKWLDLSLIFITKLPSSLEKLKRLENLNIGKIPFACHDKASSIRTGKASSIWTILEEIMMVVSG